MTVILEERHPQRQRGAVLLIVLILTFSALAVTTTYLYRAEMSARETGELLRRRRAFYAVDGMSRLVIREVQNYMVENPDPSTEDLQNPENISAPEIEGFYADQFQIESTGAAFDGPIINGPFEGMYGHQKPVLIDMHAVQPSQDMAGQVLLRVTLAQVSLFQFFVFGDGYTELFPGPNMTINPGRVHANGDLCLGSSSTFQIERVTASGRVLSADGRCLRTTGSGTYLWNGSRYILMNSQNSSECTNCASSGLKWKAYALSTWRGYVRDKAHGVPRLRLPITGTPQTQAGGDAGGGIVSNEGKLRVLIDPILATDSKDILTQKFAMQADLRIINGVWYLNDGTWPGKPIWSDHPGSFTTTNEEGLEGSPQAVGQRDLKKRFSWSSLPKRFSYYEYDEAGARLFDDARGIISYGGLVRTTTPSWQPGFWARGAQNKTYTDVDGKSRYDYCNFCSNASKCSASLAFRDASTPLCQSYVNSTYANAKDAQYLQATRAGFIDQRVRTSDSNRGNILPVNFDVAQFTAALQDTSPGELGSYFEGGASFNGIVYITHTWPGSMAGLPNNTAALWPATGSQNDSSQVQNYSVPMAQTALPFPLCSSDLGYDANVRRIGFSLPPSDGASSNGFEPFFTIPNCAASKSLTTRPNAVRVINGATIDGTIFPAGLSIVSNLPVYVVGPFNSGSNTSSQSSTPWSATMIGADALTLLSKNWDDKNSPWDNSASYSARVASATTYNFCFLGGMVETVDSNRYSGGMENFPRFLENWTNITATISGSFVFGFASVYQRQPWKYGSPIYDAPTRVWAFDKHLTILGNQPPGAPRFSTHSVSRLNRL